MVGASRKRAPDFHSVNLSSFSNKDSQERGALSPSPGVASPYLFMSNEEGQTLLARLFGPMMKGDGHSFRSQFRSQMQVSFLERHDGELAEKLQSLFAPLDQISPMQILQFALYGLSNNFLSEDATDEFLKWIIEQKQDELLVKFLKTPMPSVHACAAKIPESILRIGDADFLANLIASGIDISPLKGGRGGIHLAVAAREGNLQIVQILLKNGADVDPPADEDSALQLAAINGHANIAQVLLKAGANIDAITTNSGWGNTALSYAVFHDSTELIRILVTAGANVDICQVEDLPIIKWSAFHSSDEVHQTLLSGCREDHSSLTSEGICEAAKEGIQALSEYLAESGEELSCPALDVLKFALHRAVDDFEDEPQVLLSLFSIGVDPNAQVGTEYGQESTPLLRAIKACNIKSIKILIEAGANINAPSIISAAVQKETTEILRLILEAGANIKSSAEEALRYAIIIGNLEAVQFLLVHGAEDNNPERNCKFPTPLQLAVESKTIQN